MSLRRSYQIHPETILNVSFTGTQGPTLIFLHFWGGSSATFSSTISYLSTTCRTIVIDFRGWGSSSGPQSPNAYSIKELATDVEILIKDLGVEDCVLVGHSMGGKVAQLIAGRRLTYGLRTFVLIAPAPPTPMELPLQMKEQQLAAYSTPESAEFVIKNVLSSSILQDDLLAGLVKDMMRGNEFAKRAWPEYAMAENILGEAENLQVPTLVIAGEKDQVETLEKLEREVIGNIKNAKLVVVQGAGHLLPVEAPEEVARHVLEFIEISRERARDTI